MKKKALSSKFIWGIYVPLGIMILGVTLDRSIPQFNLWKLLANIGKGIYHIKIPDFLHVILMIAIFISLVFINKKFHRLELKESVVFEHDACWKKDKKGNIEGGPYCSKCYDSERKLMNLVSCGDAKYSECPICKKPLRIKYREPWKPSKIENEGTPFDDK